MNIPQAPLNSIANTSLNPPNNQPSELRRQKDVRQISPEMRKAAEGLESVFTQQMMHAMRETVEPSEFSLHNSASDIYQGMLDEEYSDIAAKQNSLGLSEQIIDYWLRDKASPQYTNHKDAPKHPGPKVGPDVSSSKVRTGGTHED